MLGLESTGCFIFPRRSFNFVKHLKGNLVNLIGAGGSSGEVKGHSICYHHPQSAENTQYGITFVWPWDTLHLTTHYKKEPIGPLVLFKLWGSQVPHELARPTTTNE